MADWGDHCLPALNQLQHTAAQAGPAFPLSVRPPSRMPGTPGR